MRGFLKKRGLIIKKKFDGFSLKNWGSKPKKGGVYKKNWGVVPKNGGVNVKNLGVNPKEGMKTPKRGENPKKRD